MKRCNACFHYAAGHPTYCPHCGRSYDVRLCPRGHASQRDVRFCAVCGSEDLSTPAPPEGALARLSRWVLRLAVGTAAATAAGAIGLVLIERVDWRPFADPLLRLLLALGLLYWTTTLLPGPVRKVGRAAGRRAWKAVKGRPERDRR